MTENRGQFIETVDGAETVVRHHRQEKPAGPRVLSRLNRTLRELAADTPAIHLH